MMLTEEEAKTKWCPMVRVPFRDDLNGSPVACAINRPQDEPHLANCIGSACAVWRWQQKPIHDRHATPTEDAENVGLGYCGLAGASQ